jgi:hypothetical protein
MCSHEGRWAERRRWYNPAMIDPRRPRRWLRFSLRTLLVVMTVLAVWMGRQLSWVRERETLLSAVLERGDAWIDAAPARWQTPARLPFGWRLFGAEPLATIWIQNRGFDKGGTLTADEFLVGSEEARRLRAAFPEAYIHIKQYRGQYAPELWVIDDPNKGNVELPDDQYTLSDLRQFKQTHPESDVWLIERGRAAAW